MLGWSMVLLGSVLAVPQLVADQPWQAGLAVGLLLAGLGALRLADARRPR